MFSHNLSGHRSPEEKKFPFLEEKTVLAKFGLRQRLADGGETAVAAPKRKTEKDHQHCHHHNRGERSCGALCAEASQVVKKSFPEKASLCSLEPKRPT